MALPHEFDSTQELLEAQAHVWSQVSSFFNSASLKCAIELGIPDIIHNHRKPMSLSALVESLPVAKAKSQFIPRLMRFLVHSKFFVEVSNSDDEGEARYWLTPSSRLLLRDAPLTAAPFALLVLDPIFTRAWGCMSEWLVDEHHATSVEKAYGMKLWELARHEPRLGSLFNEAMSSDSRLLSHVLVRDCKHVFEGIASLVDVGGGIGTTAKAIVEAFPCTKCVVLDLPHVVAGLEGGGNLTYVGGDMFDTIPPADAVLLKWILHNWNDEGCVKILKNCKDAIPRGRGKVMIIDMVLGSCEGEDKAMEELRSDMVMMTIFNGKERSEKEWGKLFFEAGFTSSKINPAFGMRSLIEVYP